MIAALFFALGASAGALHALALGRAAGRAPSPASFLLRFGAVTLALVGAAVLGYPLAAAGGWFAGFASAVVLVARRASE